MSTGSIGAGSGSSSGDTTSVVQYPDGSTVTTVRNARGQVVSVTVTAPAASRGGTVSSAIDLTA